MTPWRHVSQNKSQYPDFRSFFCTGRRFLDPHVMSFVKYLSLLFFESKNCRIYDAYILSQIVIARKKFLGLSK